MRMIAVDDEQVSLGLLCAEIRKVVPNDELVTFSLPQEALEYAKSNAFDVAFFDIEMPGMNGIELAKTIKKLQPRTNFIFVTAYTKYALDAVQLHSSGYLLKPVTSAAIKQELDNLRFPNTYAGDHIFIRTFGDFELSVSGSVVHFRRSKSKEMLAYLVDHNGEGVTRKELAYALFHDEEYTMYTQDYINKVISELERSLKEAGAEKKLIRRRNFYAVDKTQFSCDLYDYIKGTPSAVNLFNGEYMLPFEWGAEAIKKYI